MPQNTTIVLTDSELIIDFGWDKPNFEFETGLIAFNYKLNLVDYVCRFRPSGLKDAIRHSGNDVPNYKQIIQISLDEIYDAGYLAVILYSENGISFDQAKNIYISISNKKEKIGKCIINKTEKCFGLLLGIFQTDVCLNDWYFTVLAEPFKAGDIYESSKNIQKLLINYSLNILELDYKKSDNLPKGEILYKTSDWVKISSKFIYIGLGHKIKENNILKFNASILTYDKSNNLIDIINTNKMKNKNKSIIIYDELNKSKIPQTKTDDILLFIDFRKLDNKISTLIIAINTFPLKTFFNAAYNVYIRLFDKFGPDGIHTISKFSGIDNLIIMGQLRKDDDFWYFEPIGQRKYIYYEKEIYKISLSIIKNSNLNL